MGRSSLGLWVAAFGLAVASCGDDGGGESVDTDAGTGSSMGSSDPTTVTTTTSGTASTTTTTGSSTSSSSTTTTGPEPTDFDDEFDDSATLANWTRLHETEGDPPTYEVLDVDTTTPGQLTLIPEAGGWFGEFDGPFLYKMVSGDFVVETSVAANRRGQDGGPPQGLYNSAGLFARDPASGDGAENWIMHNVGNQSLEVGVATEGKTTTNSQSTLMLTPGTWSGRLRLCRVGSRFVLARQLSDESGWTETNSYDRADMPAELQLGMVVNGWNSNGSMPDLGLEPDIVATFDYIRLWRPESGEASCTEG